jgi:hypothetical protein
VDGRWRLQALLPKEIVIDGHCFSDSPVKLTATCTPCPGCSGGGAPQQNTGTGDDPLLISVADDEYPLSSFEDGVKFDLDLDGEPERTAWTLGAGDEAFLVLDRNANGQIDNALEVFGDRTAQLPSDHPNGFRALEVFDDTLSGGNGDGRIDAYDSVYGSLQLWTDRDHNGKSSAAELRSLDGVITAIHLDYQQSDLLDKHGHAFRYWARIEKPEGAPGAGIAWNVFFAKPPAVTRR